MANLRRPWWHRVVSGIALVAGAALIFAPADLLGPVEHPSMYDGIRWAGLFLMMAAWPLGIASRWRLQGRHAWPTVIATLVVLFAVSRHPLVLLAGLAAVFAAGANLAAKAADESVNRIVDRLAGAGPLDRETRVS